MRPHLRSRLRLAAAAALVVAVALGPSVGHAVPATAVGTTYQPIEGAGSTWSANALQQWIRNVFDNYRWKISYSDQGSSAGRQLFAQGTTDFGVSEIPYALANSDSPDPRPARSFAYVPVVAGGTAFMYNLVIGGQRVTNLRLSGEVLAKIFTGVITKWNDPAIAADNPKLSLPAITIVPVVRSDGSGTTAQLTTWMRSQHPEIWNAYCARAGRTNCGITSNYPVVPGSAFLAQQGSNQVASTVAKNSSVGAITYVEASYAINARFPVVKMLNAAGYYNEPTASNVAVSLLAAVINNDPTSQEYLTANLAPVYTNRDPRTYPLSSYSYMIIPTALEGNFTEDKGLTLADFAAYFLCEGQQQADVLGYSPLPINLVQGGLDQVQKIPGGNTANKNIASCNNPTFSPDGTNKLANEAPQPQACDKKGADQCLTGTGGASGTTNTAGGGSTTSGSGSGSESESDGSTDGTGSAPSTTGEATGLSGGGDPVVAGEPLTLASRNVPIPNLVFMVLAVVLALAAVILPPIIGRRRAAPALARAAGAATAVRGRTLPRALARPTAAVRSLAGRVPQLPKPSVHLPSWFRKVARAERPDSES
ncbi:phosphate ABC transporter substrate-binding protein PstS [Pseudolysinimonas sp.]|uniref:phosphate ABC transporter substrate-binding protein PstS n=1 Tax=Pseudolysinimonas sp. TaxID=2680009 RepID=UPI00286BE224|nr:phosphate ABC transporter substrate-binding protein PstS [Pseudolysinimonas sp.]